MKKFITLLVAILISTTTFAQKNELKAASKALDANNFAQTIQVLKSVEPTISSAKEKYKTQYYFLLGKALYANGTTPNSFVDAAKAFNTLFEIEKSGIKKYTNDAAAVVNSMVEKVSDQANKDYDEGVALKGDEISKEKSKTSFISAAKGFEKMYQISKKDTASLQNCGLAYFWAEEYALSNEKYIKLKDIGYTGKATYYTATNVLTNKRIGYASEKDMNEKVKMKLAIDPKIEKRESQRNSIYRWIAKNYIALEDHENALASIKEVQAADPDDVSLLVDEANVYYAMGDNLKYKQKLEEAVSMSPNDHVLHYNIGVTKIGLQDYEGAIASFIKTTELNPNFTDAYMGIGETILKKEVPIFEEMNKTTDFGKYDKLKLQLHDVYREALPYYEKAFELDTTRIGVVQTLMGIYENLEISEKAQKFKELYNEMKK